jgi:hypothetical protein
VTGGGRGVIAERYDSRKLRPSVASVKQPGGIFSVLWERTKSTGEEDKSAGEDKLTGKDKLTGEDPSAGGDPSVGGEAIPGA